MVQSANDTVLVRKPKFNGGFGIAMLFARAISTNRRAELPISDFHVSRHFIGVDEQIL